MAEGILQTQTGRAQHRVHALEHDRARRADVFGRIHAADKDKLAHPDGVAGGSQRERYAFSHHLRTVAIGRGYGIHPDQPVGTQGGHADEAGRGRAIRPERCPEQSADIRRRGIVREHDLKEHEVVRALPDRGKRTADVLQRALGLRHRAGWKSPGPAASCATKVRSPTLAPTAKTGSSGTRHRAPGAWGGAGAPCEARAESNAPAPTAPVAPPRNVRRESREQSSVRPELHMSASLPRSDMYSTRSTTMGATTQRWTPPGGTTARAVEPARGRDGEAVP